MLQSSIYPCLDAFKPCCPAFSLPFILCPHFALPLLPGTLPTLTRRLSR